MKKAIILLSGGIDSSTTLYLAKSQGYQPTALIFDYHQRHKKE
ncbi:MAG: 7-cyano-7-deazaguanine synthase, partial [bacterium (Candidatus Ratteibacteria) CG_4_8_14_3_um_filter_41_36]